MLHMDVKFPVDNYLRHLEATTDHERDAAAKAFLRDVRNRVKELSGPRLHRRRRHARRGAAVHPQRERVGLHPRAGPGAHRRRHAAEGRPVLAGEPVRGAGRDPPGRRPDPARPHVRRDPPVPQRLPAAVDQVRRRGRQGREALRHGPEEPRGPHRHPAAGPRAPARADRRPAQPTAGCPEPDRPSGRRRGRGARAGRSATSVPGARPKPGELRQLRSPAMAGSVRRTLALA